MYGLIVLVFMYVWFNSIGVYVCTAAMDIHVHSISYIFIYLFIIISVSLFLSYSVVVLYAHYCPYYNYIHLGSIVYVRNICVHI